MVELSCNTQTDHGNLVKLHMLLNGVKLICCSQCSSVVFHFRNEVFVAGVSIDRILSFYPGGMDSRRLSKPTDTASAMRQASEQAFLCL